jgi:hypothetical protein
MTSIGSSSSGGWVLLVQLLLWPGVEPDDGTADADADADADPADEVEEDAVAEGVALVAVAAVVVA